MSVENAHVSYEPCPNCRKEIPVSEGFSKWCAACGWNLNLEDGAPQRGLLGRINQGLGHHSARKLLETYINAPASVLRPRTTVGSIAAFIIVIAIHLASLVVGALGIYLIVTGWPKIFPIILGCLMLGLFWLLLPRFRRLPGQVLSETDFPAIYALVAEICNQLKVPPVRHIVVDADFNASIGNYGLRGVPLLCIGLPLWKTLDNRQRVALLAHEISHRANGDPARGTFTHTALHTLYEWYEILTQQTYYSGGIGAVIGELFMRLLAVIVKAFILVLSLLLWHNSQKAEYLADYLGTTVCGTDAMLETLDQIRVGVHSLHRILVKHVISTSQSGKELLTNVAKAMEEIPAHERERIRRVDEATEGSLDATHPPTAFRIRFLEHHRIDSAKLILSDEQAADIAAEFAPFEEAHGRRIIYAVLGE